MEKNLAMSMNNILQIIEDKCVDAGGDIHVNPKYLGEFREETEYLAARLGLTPFQSILFSVIVQNSSSCRCSITSVGKALGMRYLEILSYSEELNKLKEKWLIRIRGNGEIRVPKEVIDSIMNNQPFEKPKIEGLNSLAIFRRIAKYLEMASDGQMTIEESLDTIETLVSANPETSIGKAAMKYLKYPINTDERYLFYTLLLLYEERGMSVFDFEDFDVFFPDKDTLDMLRIAFEVDALTLQQEHLIEHVGQDGLMSKESFVINEKIREEFFSDLTRKHSGSHTVRLTESKEKPLKQLFYNDREGEQVRKLEALLGPNSLSIIFERLKANGLRTGFTCLFYGSPGTGKTETVYQIAKKTGRKILEADVASLRNCYVGETEKNVRKFFDDYRTACEENDLEPILLFNEADAILGTRMDGAVKAVDRMENSVQNILLQEMENLSGIMIATTNLCGNLDKAFERRFLYKICFDKPGPEPMARIWKSQFPTLSDCEAMDIAMSYSLSGGQIENIVRRVTIDSALSGSVANYNTLLKYCGEECLTAATSRKIGF